jgi:adenylate cyclase
MRRYFHFDGYGRQRIVRSLTAGLAIALCGLVVILMPRGETLERRYGLDWLFNMRGSRTPPPGVVVVEINNDTGKALDFLDQEPGAWPTRTVYARLIDRLVKQEKAQGVVFDLLFDHPKPGDPDLARAIEESRSAILLDWLEGGQKPIITKNGDGGSIYEEQTQHPTKDLKRHARAVGPWVVAKLEEAAFQFWAFKSSDVPTLPAAALQLKSLNVYEEWLGVLKEAHASGIDHLPTRADEVKNSANMLQLMRNLRAMFQDDSLKREIAPAIDRFFRKKDDVSARPLVTALAALYLGPDDYFINFYGPPGKIPSIPFQTFLKEGGVVGNNDLSKTMVFVGRSDPTKFHVGRRGVDTFTTSFSENGVDLSGVEIMATAYANLLSRRALLPSDKWIQALTVVSFGLLVGTLVYLLPATVGVLAACAVAGLYVFGVQWRFNVADVWLPLWTPILVQMPLALLIGLIGQYLLERRKERRLTEAIGYYLPENIVRDLAETPVDPTTLNRVSFGTCLATDMSDFMALAETKPPRELAIFMNEYFDALAQTLKRHGVDVMEFRADMIMCAWVSPTKSLAICRKGLEAAIEVSDIVKQFAQRYGSRHFNPRVGLQDGEVYVGHTGGGGRFLYSIVGDTANTAARLESLNKHLGTQVLATESVTRSADGLLLRPLGLFQLKGKTDPTSIVEILGHHDTAKPELQDLCERFAEALAAFQCKEWHRANSLFEALASKYNEDRTSHFYWSCSQKYAHERPVHAGPVCIRMSEK